MRKILLATTAVAAAAVFGAAPLAAQEAPTVRVGGYFRFNYAFTDQDGVAGSTSNVAGTQVGTPAAGTANLGKSDFASDMEIHVIVQGKAANGVSYGATIEVQDDFNRQATSGVSSKNQLDTDEMYVWISSPQAGQLRFGDEDGVVLGALATGWITSFGTGGIDGDWLDNVVGSNNRPSYFVGGGLNDSTKIIYTSPQFFGFDFGASFGFNDGEGEDSGCEVLSNVCDRYDSGTPYNLRRKNEVQAAVRYRGSFAGVGVAALAGYIGSGATKNPTGLSGEGLSVGVFGLQATAYGFTAGANYAFGRSQAGLGLLANGPATPGATFDDRDMQQWVGGVSYTISNLTVGANFFDVRSAGSQTNPAARKDKAWSVGANYNLAPGLALVAEYTSGSKEERGLDLDSSRAGIQDKTNADVFILGTRIAF